MAKHTPGEWVVTGGENGSSHCVYALDNPYSRVARNRMYVSVSCDPRIAEPGEQTANAYLFAASRELLQLLKEVTLTDLPPAANWADRARAAIRKAEGR